MRYRVTCTTKHDSHERITHIGCYANNVYTYLSEAEVFPRIENRVDTFYVERPDGHLVDVVVAERDGKKYLKTEADGEKPDNLLSLPDCPPKNSESSGKIRTVVAAPSHGCNEELYWGA